MCGFFGCASPRRLTASDLSWLEQGTSRLRHRGPDDEGFVLLGRDGKARSFRGDDSIPECGSLVHIRTAAPGGANVALGSRRLAIIDLSPGGHMPMSDGDGNWLVFNGEIYNYRELRDQLLSLGHQFASHSDTEVVLRAYAQWGTSCLDHFNGMWAFALWDRLRGRLFCSRDRFGEKQLYYHPAADGALWFGSEIGPLRIVTGGNEPVNRPLVWDFLMYGLADHQPETFFTGIQQLMPGTFLMFHPGEQPQVVRYYDLAARAVPSSCTVPEASAALRQHLCDSVRLRLRSDVPVAGFFSGGLDSCSIVALASQILPSLNGSSPYKVLRTYTNAYPEGHPYDESPRVRTALAGLQAVDARFIPASVENFKRDLLDMVERQEQPFHNVSIFAAYNLLRLVREQDGIKVVLTGEAGDELLGGYQRVYLPLRLSATLLRGEWGDWIRESRAWSWPAALRASAKGFFRKVPAAVRGKLHQLRNPVVAVMRKDFLDQHRKRDEQLTGEWRALDLNRRLIADLTQFNLPQLLRHLDRNAMRWSIETRVPFLDHHLVEFACSLPETWKIHGGYSKYILRQAMAGDLPEAIVWNRTKLGFGMEEQFWLSEALDLMHDSAALHEFIDVRELRRAVRSRDRAQQPYWLPISLGMWLQTAYPEAN
jgi:asparagine synthase (glutamine-hydrolysing)